MPITVKNNTSLADLSSNMRNRIRRELEQRLPELADRIVDRTLAGRDADGNTFAPYNEDYRRRKDREAIFGGSPVNLALTGEMLASVSTSVSGGGNQPVTGKIEVTGGFNRDKARFNSNRKFMELDGVMRTDLSRFIRNAVSRIRRR